MTAAQILTWFFKEQKSMVLLRDAYVTINPIEILTETIFNDSKKAPIERFDKFINRIVKGSGFLSLLDYIVYAYINAIKKKFHYQNYHDTINKIEEKFVPLRKKWLYFVKHNVFSDSIKVGDKLYVDWYYDLQSKVQMEMNITNIDIYRGLVKGMLNYKGVLKSHSVWINNLKDKDGNSIEFKYFIKRRGGVYYGTDIL